MAALYGTFLLILTAGVVAFGILHVEMEFLHWAWNKLKKRGQTSRESILAQKSDGAFLNRKIPRFDTQQRVQHLLLFGSFIILAVTGIPQKFYTFTPFDSFIAVAGGMETLRIIHRVAAGVMVLGGMYHLIYLVPGMMNFRDGVPRLKVGRWLNMIPSPKDFRDFFQMIGYYLGRNPQPVRSGRFTYMEKFDYWAVFWGLTIMAVSGTIMILPVLGLESPSTAIVAAALAAHSDEAILAVG